MKPPAQTAPGTPLLAKHGQQSPQTQEETHDAKSQPAQLHTTETEEADAAGGMQPRDFQNKFNYRMKTAPPHIKELYDKLKKNKDDTTKIKDFRQNVATINVKDSAAWDSALFSEMLSVSEESMEGTAGSWVPYEKFKRDYGEHLALELIRTNSVDSQRHSGLLPGSTIPWPYNLEVRDSRTVSSKKDIGKKKRKVEAMSTTDIEHCELIQAAVTSVGQARSSTQAAPPPSPGTHQLAQVHMQVPVPPPLVAVPSPELVEAITSLKKGHAEYDRKRREFTACLVQSADCAFTRGCNFERLLKTAVDDGDEIDARLMTTEQSYLASWISIDTNKLEKANDCRDCAVLLMAT